MRNFVRAGLSELIAMALSGHLTNSVFRRYDISSGSDLESAADKLDAAAAQPATTEKNTAHVHRIRRPA